MGTERPVPHPPTVLADRVAIEVTVTRLGREISARHHDGVVMVAVLKGSLLFVSDLVRCLTVQPVVEFLAISRYEPDSGRVRILKDLDLDVTGRDVILVEDIVDTGLTLGFLLGELERRSPASLEVCTLLDKRVRRILPVPLAYVGFEVPDVFVLGYGLDFAGRYRNLDMLIAADAVALTAEPDAYVERLYGDHRARGPG